MQNKSHARSRTLMAKRPWLWLVLVGFLWLQLIGVVHQHSHSDFNLKTTKLEQLLPEHSQQNKSDCQLLDLHCGGLALAQALPVLALPMVAMPVVRSTDVVFSVQPHHSYQARAPPLTSI